MVDRPKQAIWECSTKVCVCPLIVRWASHGQGGVLRRRALTARPNVWRKSSFSDKDSTGDGKSQWNPYCTLAETIYRQTSQIRQISGGQTFFVRMYRIVGSYDNLGQVYFQ